MSRFYNYSKTAARGVKDFSLTVDERMVFMGSLRASPEEVSLPVSRVVPLTMRSQGQAVVLSSEVKVVNCHKDFVPSVNTGDQDVLCINERQVMVRSKTMYEHPVTVDILQR